MVKSMRAALRSLLWRPIRRLVNDRRAVSAVEFALVLPVMLTIYIGGNQVSQALTAGREVDHVASTMGDLVAQSKTLSNSDMTNILNAAASVMAPFPTSLLRIKVSGVTFNASTVATVTWSDQFQDTALTVGSTVTSTIPTALQLPSTFLVIAEVHYAYTPSMGYVLTGTFDLTQKLYFYPRDSSTITRTS
jgi:Flp pilus assembly protein TadG